MGKDVHTPHWTDKALRTGTEGKTEGWSDFLLLLRRPRHLQPLTLCSHGFWLQDVLRLRLVLGALPSRHGEPLSISSDNIDQY